MLETTEGACIYNNGECLFFIPDDEYGIIKLSDEKIFYTWRDNRLVEKNISVIESNEKLPWYSSMWLKITTLLTNK